MFKFFKNLFAKEETSEVVIEEVQVPEVVEETPKHKIVAISTNKKNVIKQVQLDNGNVLDIKQAVELTEQGLIEGVEVWSVRNGHKALRSIPDADTTNNLKDLPRF